jgi:SAM-dependent methyltransferase
MIYSNFPCRLCGTEKLLLLYTQGNKQQYKFYRCPECSLVNYDLAAGLCQDKYIFSEADLDFYDPGEKTNRDQKQSYAFIKKWVKQKGRLLDIGCGNGYLLYCAREDGWQVTGIELSERLTTALKTRYNLDIITGDFLNFKARKGGEFDLIVLRHVLEHIPDCRAVMSKLSELIAPQGQILIECPNIDGYELKFKRLRERLKLGRKKYSERYIPGHCNEFNHRSFSYLCELFNFRIERYETYSHNPFLNLFYRTFKIGAKVRFLLIRIN